MLVLLLDETIHFTTDRFWKIEIVLRVCNHYPLPTLHYPGLRIYIGKNVTVKNWMLVREKCSKVPILEYCYSVKINFSNLSTATEEFRSHNKMSSVTVQRKSKGELQPQWVSNSLCLKTIISSILG